MRPITRKPCVAQPLTLEEADAVYRERTREQDREGVEGAVDDAEATVGRFVEACLAAAAAG